MKTIATAAVLMMLTVPAWAGEPQTTQANDKVNAGEPVVLSEAEMDGVTAGGQSGKVWFLSGAVTDEISDSSSTSASGTTGEYWFTGLQPGFYVVR